MTLPPTASLDAYNRVLLADPGELDVALPRDALVGELPEALRGGTWWGNGPSKLRVGDRLVHPFDGHGFLRAIRFAHDGSIRFTSRFVRTPVFEAEQAAGGLVEVGLGTLPSRDRWTNVRARFGRQVANTCVLPWGDRLYALYEGAHPQRVDPVTLATLGDEDFHGALHPREAFCAHTRVDPITGTLVGLSPRVLGPAMDYTVREIDIDGRETFRRKERLDAFNVAHDFVITPRWVVVIENSIDVSLLGLLRTRLGRSTLLQALSASKRNARALLIPRGPGPARIVDLGRPLISVHHANAWEEGDRVVLVTCGLPSFAFGTEFGWRGQDAPFDSGDERTNLQEVLRFDLDGTRATARTLSSIPLDFPAVRADRVGRPTRHLYGMVTREQGASMPFSAIAHVDLETGASSRWQVPAGVVGEPLVAPRGDAEDDVFVLAMLYAPSHAELCVLDGRDLARGPLARVRLPVALPFGFHGFWQQA